jgi:hypothetical protein
VNSANGTRIIALDAQRVAAVRTDFPFLHDRHV